jgi:hypothetical protein
MKSELLFIVIVSSIMLFKTVNSLGGINNFNAESFEKVIRSPLDVATYLCLGVYLFHSGKNKSRDTDLRGRSSRRAMPLSLVISMFTASNAVGVLKGQGKKGVSFSDKMLGVSGLYALWYAGSSAGNVKTMPMKQMRLPKV